MLYRLARHPVLGVVLALVVLAPAMLAVAQSVAAQDRFVHESGEFEFWPSITGVLIAAPHGTSDRNTLPVAASVARRLGAGYLGFRSTAAGDRINVNRPTEGQGRACPDETATERARFVYETYLWMVGAIVGPLPPVLYVEIHGQAHPQRTSLIDTATKGLSVTEVAALKDRFPAADAAARREQAGFPALRLLVEPIDRIYYSASCAKQFGILGLDRIPRAVHFEFPPSARQPATLEGTAALTAELVRPLAGGR
jgi:hypothetical protein